MSLRLEAVKGFQRNIQNMYACHQVDGITLLGTLLSLARHAYHGEKVCGLGGSAYHAK